MLRSTVLRSTVLALMGLFVLPAPAEAACGDRCKQKCRETATDVNFCIAQYSKASPAEVRCCRRVGASSRVTGPATAASDRRGGGDAPAREDPRIRSASLPDWSLAAPDRRAAAPGRKVSHPTDLAPSPGRGGAGLVA